MMTDGLKGNGHEEALIKYWMEKARESLESAESEYLAGRLSPAVNRVYYACFYAVSAVMQNQGKTFKKHKAVRSALHRDLVKTGLLDVSWGHFYEDVFDSRQRGDYQPIVNFEPEQVKELLDQAKGFVGEMEKLLIQSTDL
jgi:uncharacterized protein (UPF0332 family)